jgi:putative oxidoreductase
MTLRVNSLQLMKFGPLPIRILAGLTLMLHGLPKITDISGVQSFFPNIGLPPELAIPVALLEVIGGLAILFGILTRIASGLFIIEMIGVVVVAKLSKGFVGGYELELLIMAICISLFITGPGRISIEYEVLKREIFPRGKQMVERLREKSALS